MHSSCPCKTCTVMSGCKNRCDIRSVWTGPRCPQSVLHFLVTDVMPMGPYCVSGSDCSRPQPFCKMCELNVMVVLRGCYSSLALFEQVTDIASLLELVPKGPTVKCWRPKCQAT